MVVLGGLAVSYERRSPVLSVRSRTIASGQEGHIRPPTGSYVFATVGAYWLLATEGMKRASGGVLEADLPEMVQMCNVCVHN